MTETSHLLTMHEFARRLGVSARRARALAASGRVEGAVKVGRDWLIPASARVVPGTRGPRSRAAEGETRLVLAERGRGQALKRRRQKRFRKLAAGSPQVRGAAAFRLPREDLHFDEPDLRPDELL
jgi:hypothetical protein